MCTFFHARGYPEPVVRSAKERVLNVHREECLAEKTAMPSDKIPLVVPYDNFGQRVVNIIKKNAKILQRDADIGNLFENNIVTAFSNHKNLKSILVLNWFKPVETCCNRLYPVLAMFEQV